MELQNTLQFIREKECCVVAGNGPSLANIDYARLPKDYDVFRCNQFYFEDKYFLGKKIKAYFANPSMMPYQYCTIKTIQQKKQYEVENFFCSSYAFLEEPGFLHSFSFLFPDVLNGSSTLSKHKEFLGFLAYHYLYERKTITSGIYMCVMAMVLGYKEIYLSGIDLYQGERLYVFNPEKTNILKAVPHGFKSVGDSHSKNYDLEVLKLLESYGVKIYTLNPNSIMEEFFPLAPLCNFHNAADFAQERSVMGEDPIQDLIMPNEKVLAHYHSMMHGQPFEPNLFIRHFFVQPKQNLYFKIFYDFFQLPKILKHYLLRKLSKMGISKQK